MSQEKTSIRTKRQLFTARRIALLASVTGIGVSALLVGPSSIGLPAWTSSALAAETTLQAPGFADLVAKVKPAVISVRVTTEAAARTAYSNRNRDNFFQSQPGSALDDFLRRFRFRDMPNGFRRGLQNTAAEGSGFFVSADGYAVTNNHVVAITYSK
jgi:serine protease Do